VTRCTWAIWSGVILAVVLDTDGREVHSKVKGDVKLIALGLIGRRGDTAAFFMCNVHERVSPCIAHKLDMSS
jgi:hypothetical protein